MAGGANVVARAADRRECPPVDALSAFASGRLSEQETSGVYRHLTRCATCSGLLDRLPPIADALSGELKAAERPWPVLAEPELSRMQAAVRALPVREPPAADREHETTISSRLSTEDSAIAASPRREEETVSLTPELPERIGKYEVQSLLGKGAFGQVFLALDPELGRRVALKVPRPGIPLSQAMASAFLHEARSAALLKHSGIITVYEVGQDRDYGCFIAMEYAEGGSLKQRIAGVRPPAEQAARWIAQAAEALHYAHKQRLVHRDLKPANLLLNAEGSVKVADFGLAILEEQQREHAGEFAGTLGYISPEQLRGDVHHLDGRTDIWSLGVILYELLAGRRPFTGNPDAVTDDILHRPPKPPRQIDDSIPAELERICLKCLSKEAGGRYSTAKDLKEDLLRFLQPSLISRNALLTLTTGAFASCLLTMVGVWLLGTPSATLPTAKTSVESNTQESSEVIIVDATSEDPFNVDAVAESFVPHVLFSRAPQLPFPLTDPREKFLFDARREEAFLNSPSVILANVAETNAPQYRLSVEISKSSPRGISGMYIGYRPMDKPLYWECQMVGLNCDDGGLAFIARRRLIVQEVFGQNFAVSQLGLAKEEVERSPAMERDILEVVVEGARIAKIRWRGQDLPGLADDSLDAGKSAPSTSGTFGIVNFQGSATYHNMRFTKLGSLQP